MGQPTAPELVADLEREIGRLMPTALDMIATVTDNPGGNWDLYSGLLEVCEAHSSILLLAVLRTAAGLAAIGEMDGKQVRALGA